MSIINIVVISILIIIILWIMSSTIIKSNIVMDLITDCRAPGTPSAEGGSNLFSSNSSNPNYVDKTLINSYKSQNIMISSWFYIENWNTTDTDEKNILYIGSSENNTLPDVNWNTGGITDLSCITGSNYKNISIVLDKYENNMFIYVLCGKGDCKRDGEYSLSKYKISNIPIQKWNNVTISIDAKLLDVYLDGKLLNSFILPGIIQYTEQDAQNIYIGNIGVSNTIWNGFITRIRFEPNSITPNDALNIYNAGINSNHTNSLLSKYSLKVSFLEYNKEKGSLTI